MMETTGTLVIRVRVVRALRVVGGEGTLQVAPIVVSRIWMASMSEAQALVDKHHRMQEGRDYHGREYHYEWQPDRQAMVPS